MVRHQFVSAFVLLGIPLLPACQSGEFDDCSATRSCPSAGGQAGGGGSTSMAGSSGTGAAGAGAAGAGAAGAGAAGAGSPSGSSGAGAGGTAGAGAAGSGGFAATGGGEGGLSGEAGESGESAGGQAGAGGEASAPEPPECVRDSDCDDEKACNGAETCEDGSCREGEPFCVTPDAENCSVRCEEGGLEPTCSIEALDVDEDGFASALCAEAPGDDCNDRDAEIKPGAAEECDGLDNDCNELVDLEDGLPLGGTVLPIPGFDGADLTWSPDHEAFALVLERDGGNGISLATLQSSAALTGEPVLVVDASGTHHPNVVSAGGRLGISFVGSTGQPSTNALTVDTSNTASSVFQTLGRSSAIAPLSSGNFVVLRTYGSLGYAHRFDGQVLDAEQIVVEAEDLRALRVATVGTEGAYAWHDDDTRDVLWRQLSAALTPVGTQPMRLDVGGAFPDITATTDGYAVAWIRDAGSLAFARARLDGSVICSKLDLEIPGAFELATLQNLRVRLADTQYGTLLLFKSDTGHVVLLRIGTDCSVTAQFDLAELPAGASTWMPALAVGGSRVAASYVDRASSTVYARVFGERLCD